MTVFYFADIISLHLKVILTFQVNLICIFLFIMIYFFIPFFLLMFTKCFKTHNAKHIRPQSFSALTVASRVAERL